MAARMLGLLLAGLAGLAALVAGAGAASAHGGASSDVLSVAQTLGTHELTVTMYPPADGEGDMALRVVAQGRGPAAPLQVEAVPAAGLGAGGVVSRAMVVPGSDVRDAPATVRIDRSGPWEIVLTDGPDVARIPLTVPAPVVPAWVWAVRAGLVAAVALGIFAAVAARPRPRLAAALGGGAMVAVTVVVTAAVLSTTLPAADPTAQNEAARNQPAQDHAAMSADDPMAGMAGTTGMDMGSGEAGAMSGHGSGAVLLTATPTPAGPRTTAAGPVVGGVDLALRLTDGSTGAPVDDLAVHDDALVHLAVMGPQGRLWHVHPVRAAPGRYTVRLPLADAGGYGVFAELERSEGGHQVARSAFVLDTASGVPTPGAPGGPGEQGPTAPPGGPGPRDVAGMRVDATVATPVAGRPTRIALAFSRGGAPVRDLQAWLGMAGHLMVLGPAVPGSAAPDPVDPRASFAHVHDLGTPGRYGSGPDVGFTYAFPAPGRYQLWAQVQRAGELVTVPIAVDVAPAAGAPAPVNG